MEFFIETKIKDFSSENKIIINNILKTLNADDILKWCKETYNVSLSEWYINKCFKPPKEHNYPEGFFIQLQPHIRNIKFNLNKKPKTLKEESYQYITKLENKFYPETLVNDFCNYFKVNLSEKYSQ